MFVACDFPLDGFRVRRRCRRRRARVLFVDEADNHDLLVAFAGADERVFGWLRSLMLFLLTNAATRSTSLYIHTQQLTKCVANWPTKRDLHPDQSTIYTYGLLRRSITSPD